MSRAALFRRKFKHAHSSDPVRIEGGQPTDPQSIPMSAIIYAAWLRRAGTLVLAAIVIAGAASVFGVSESTVSASGGGYDLTVEYSDVSRPGLETPWKVMVSKPGGFDGPITLRTTAEYLELFDLNGFSPEPDATRRDDKYLIMEFARPAGEEFVFSLDARLSPATQTSQSAVTALIDDGSVVAEVSYKTKVMP